MDILTKINDAVTPIKNNKPIPYGYKDIVILHMNQTGIWKAKSFSYVYVNITNDNDRLILIDNQPI